MRVLYNENDLNNRVACECGAVLEYNPLDIQQTINGDNIIYCPECLKPIEVSNMSFPKDFFHYGNGIEIEDNEINEWINDCIKMCKEEKLESTFRASGNSIVFVFDIDDAYDVYVAKNYYETEIKK